MKILGINAYHGNASAAILCDGKLVAAVEEERFNRVKYAAGFPAEAIRYCLKTAGITLSEVDHVAVPRNPSFTWELGKSAYLGGRYESFRTGDPNQANFRVDEIFSGDAVPAQTARRRQDLLTAIDSLARDVEENDQLQTFGEFQQRATALILSGEARNAFVIDR